MTDRDYYEILGLTPQADGAMVDQAYWHLARKYQSLAATNARAQRLLDELNEAYGVLGNPKLREQYDAFRDDVLIRRGMIRPAEARKGGREKQRKEPVERSLPTLELPSINLANLGWYGAAALVVVASMAGAWYGVNFALVGAALTGGLVLCLAPTLGRKVRDANLSMPQLSMPSLQVPNLNIGEIAAPAMRELGIGEKEELWDADELRASTAATLSRWRTSVGLNAPGFDGLAIRDDAGTQAEPAVVGEDSEPLAAVMDILRKNRRTIDEPTLQ
jgi:hypothetical protein